MTVRKPTALKVVEGNRGKRKLPQNEPKPRPLTPDKPDFGKNRAASAHWDQIAPILDYMGCLTEADGNSLRLLCLELATVDLCERQLQKLDDSQYVYTTSNGSEAPTAWLKQRREAAKAAESLMARLGMTPADRSKIEVNKRDDGPSPLQRIIAANARR